MSRSSRLFEIIQILRAGAHPVTAEDLARQLEVSTRTVYRDIAVLQAMRTTIEGAAGVGYMMRRGYDLPPLNFDAEEIEALHVGLSMLARTGDSALQRAAQRVCEKVEALRVRKDWLQVSHWGAPKDDPDSGIMAGLRNAIREERKLRLVYEDHAGQQTVRTVRPIGLVYHIECVMLAGWCELRHDFRHFRTDRFRACELLDERFTGQSATLRAIWLDRERWDRGSSPEPAAVADAKGAPIRNGSPGS